MIPYKLYQARRHTIDLSFDNDIRLIVKAPSWMSVEDVDAFIMKKYDWVEATRERLLAAKQKELSMRLKLESGDILPFFDRKLTLTVIREDRKTVKIKRYGENLYLWVGYEADYEYRRAQLEKWYRRLAGCMFEDKARDYAREMGVSYGKLHVKDQRSRWGSCSEKKNLNFNWRLILAPEAVCNYVIIHELCHLVHMDHSQEFWDLVETMDPQYKRHRMWLRKCSEKLYLL